MKCRNGIDTHPDILRRACDMFYYPAVGGENPCKYFKKCQSWVKRVIAEFEEPAELHRRYKAGEE